MDPKALMSDDIEVMLLKLGREGYKYSTLYQSQKIWTKKSESGKNALNFK